MLEITKSITTKSENLIIKNITPTIIEQIPIYLYGLTKLQLDNANNRYDITKNTAKTRIKAPF